MDPPDVTGLSLNQRTPPRSASPALATPPAPSHAASGAGLQLDMTLAAAVQALVHHLVQPLAVHYPHTRLMTLRQRLTELLTKAYEPSWNESNPHQASGARSLISDRVLGLPRVLREAAGKDIDLPTWSKAISVSHRKRAEGEDESEWEVWCDPGMVVWRWGGWGWDEPEFDPIRRPRESFHVIWQAAPTASASPAEASPHVTPVRTSKAIPIRAPSLLAFPPTRSEGTRSPSPHQHTATDSPSRPSTTQQQDGERDRDLMRHPSRNVSFTRPNGHKGSDSTSSHSSDSSDTNSNSHTQLLTPASRPGSADLLPVDKNQHTSENEDGEQTEAKRGRATSPSSLRPSSANSNGPTVTPYDGGNVTVLGGGTKLGGSRPSSVYGSRLDRTRSPSVSIASRALGTAVGPNSNGGASPASPRKARTRRRIIPTHIGYFGQPGVGAPVMGAFGMNQAKPYSWPHGQPGGPGSGGAGVGVGVGVSPPPVNNLAAMPAGIKRI